MIARLVRWLTPPESHDAQDTERTIAEADQRMARAEEIVKEQINQSIRTRIRVEGIHERLSIQERIAGDYRHEGGR